MFTSSINKVFVPTDTEPICTRPEPDASSAKYIAARAPCDVFYPWVRWERGQVGIWEFVRPQAAASGNLGTWKSGNLEIWGPGNPEIRGPKTQ